MRNLRHIILCLVFSGAALAQPPHKAPAHWPCVQRYIPELSAGPFWTGELPSQEQWREDRQLMRLADEVSNRALSLEKSMEKTRAFIADIDQNKRAKAALLVGALTQVINKKRNRVLAGIERYSQRQQMMLKRIGEQSQKIENIKSSGGDAVMLEELETRQKWDIRVFEERESLINHLCEQPVLLQQRLFELGRDLVAQLDGTAVKKSTQ